MSSSSTDAASPGNTSSNVIELRYIDFKTSGADRDGEFASITECIECAIGYGGRVFGGFVRDVIYPLSVGKSLSELKFKDIDIWFTNEIHAENFVEDVGSDLLPNNMVVSNDSKVYKFGRQQYNLYSNGTCIAWIDVVVSSTVPVDDFDVNKLCYNGHLLTGPVWSVGYDTNADLVNELLEQLKERRMTMLDSYVYRLFRKPENYVASDVARSRLRKFQTTGWKISAVGESGEKIFVDHDSPNIMMTDQGPKICSRLQLKTMGPLPVLSSTNNIVAPKDFTTVSIEDLVVINTVKLSAEDKKTIAEIIQRSK